MPRPEPKDDADVGAAFRKTTGVVPRVIGRSDDDETIVSDEPSPESFSKRNGHSPSLVNRLCERCAFARVSVLLHEAVLAKLVASGPFPGGPTVEELNAYASEELARFHLLSSEIVALGGSATGSAVPVFVSIVALEGLVALARDRRSTLAEAIDALLLAQISDAAGWEAVVDACDRSGNIWLAGRLAVAHRTKLAQLSAVRRWTGAGWMEATLEHEPPVPSAPASRSLLDGSPYREKRRLGSGAMGVVYLAEHRALGSEVVVKVLHPDVAAHPEVVERLRIEAQAQARLRSPHLVRCTDFGVTSEGAPYLVTERLEGRTLEVELGQRGRLSVAEAVRFACELVRGLAVAHGAGIVHRDIKPSNLFIAETEHGPVLKILDFGVAKVLPSRRGPGALLPSVFRTTEGTLIGTPRYFSPEQALRRPIDDRCDLYSAGLVLYAMLTGRGPFDDHQSMADIVAAHTTEVPRPPSTFLPHLPRSLDALVLRCLEKQPEARFESARHLLAALHETAGLEPVASSREPCGE